VGELAAGRAVAALPSVMGEVVGQSREQKAESKHDMQGLVRKMRVVWEAVTAKNLKERQAEGLGLVSVMETALGEARGDAG
jgi:hypothetical protein